MNRPEIRNIDDVWCWMNTWGDLHERGYEAGTSERLGYVAAISDLYKVLKQAGISDVPNAAWDRWCSYLADDVSEQEVGD